MKNEHTGKYVNRYGSLRLKHRPLAFRLPEMLEHMLLGIANKQNCSMSHIVRQALAEKFFSMGLLNVEQIDLLIAADLLNEKFIEREAALATVDNLFSDPSWEEDDVYRSLGGPVDEA